MSAVLALGEGPEVDSHALLHSKFESGLYDTLYQEGLGEGGTGCGGPHL